MTDLTDEQYADSSEERSKPEPTAYGALVDKMVATVATWPSEYQRSVDVHHLHAQHAEIQRRERHVPPTPSLGGAMTERRAVAPHDHAACPACGERLNCHVCGADITQNDLKGRRGMPDDLYCCHIATEEDPDGVHCTALAEFEITDMADGHYDTASVHACTAHVGHLLGHDTRLPEDAEDRWEVRALAGRRGG